MKITIGRTLRVCLLAVSGMVALAAGAPAAPSSPPPSAATDSIVLARVDDRVIRASDFRDRFFQSEAFTRPGIDSAGRMEFLNTMIGKEVLGLTARRRNRPLSFEDRMVLTQVSDRALARIFFERIVTDRVVVTEKDIRAAYAQYGSELKLRNMVLPDQAVAERVCRDLKAGRITWKQALSKEIGLPDSLLDRDLGWMNRTQLDAFTALQVFDLQPKQISNVIPGGMGYGIWQCLDRRPTTAAALPGLQRTILYQLRDVRAVPLQDSLFAEIRTLAQAHYDTANIAWLAHEFEAVNPTPTSETSTLDMRNRAPRLAPGDTARVLVTTHRGRFTTERFLSTYRSVPSMMRTRVSTPRALFNVLERMVLEPDVVEAARKLGYDRDAEYVAYVEQRREGLMVEALYEDSVMSKVRVTEAQRKKYYEDHRDEFMSRERVRFAAIPRATEAGADSVIARIKAGESPEAIVRADSIAGRWKSQVRDLRRGDAYDYQMVVFEELKVGESGKIGAEKRVVLHIMEHDFPTPMSYREVQTIVDESVQNLEAERQLSALVERQGATYRIQKYPERLMQFALTDPMGDWAVPSGD